jgi:hypothetical protein
MTAFSSWEHPRGPGDPLEDNPELGLYARLEGLVGEELRLLSIAEEKRTEAEREKLRRIGEELDRMWNRLRERAERLRPGYELR